MHIQDPAYWDTLYSNGKLDKDAWYYRAFGDTGGTVGTPSWERHRARRGAMARFFSSANVANLEPKVLARVQKLCDRVLEFRNAGRVIPLSHAYRCYATDVISDYAAPHGRDFLSTPDFSAAFNQVLRDFSELMLWHRHFPIVFPVLGAMPRWLIAKMDPTGAQLAVLDNQGVSDRPPFTRRTSVLILLFQSLMAQARAVVESRGSSQTVLDAIYTSNLIGPEDKTLTRMMAETQALFGAGTETTGNTLSVFTFHVLSQASVLRKLKTELDAAAKGRDVSDLLPSKILDKLPYLQACLKEALRMATGVSARLPRQNPLAPMSYTAPSGKTYTFPPKTTISMSIPDMHFAPDIFHDPHAFSPERWLNNGPEVLERMEKAFVPFGRGVRACLGLELAKEELTLMAGNVFHRFDFELYETTERDVRMEHDFFAPFGPKDSKGVRVIAR